MKFLITIVLIAFYLILSPKSFGQITIYQDIFYGGVTGDGYNPASADWSGDIAVNIEPGSTIRKSYLFITVGNNPTDTSFLFNGTQLKLSKDYSLNNEFSYYGTSSMERKYKTLMLDVTTLISPALNTYTITPPSGQSPTFFPGIFTEFYLLVLYENPTLQKVAVNAYINDVDANPVVNYEFIGLNEPDLSSNVGFIMNGSHYCDHGTDGSTVSVEGNILGSIGGQDSPWESACGPSGSFYYQNGTLYGLQNDVANAFMDSTDVIANIEGYITNPDIISALFEYNSNVAPQSNVQLEFFFAYTTACDTFTVNVSSDTVICEGDQVQLTASGGQAYQWWPTTGLSCTDCPNPLFTADSTIQYTVQIWNNDSCSVIRPILMKVVPNPYFGTVTITPTDCGTSNGELVLSPDTLSQTPHSYSLNSGAPQTINSFTALTSGNQNLTIIDSYGCSSDSVIFIPEQNTTVASVVLDPTSGLIPLDINVTNNSTNATDFEWYLNGNYEGNSFTSFTCDATGTYTVELVAWQYDPSCADTAYATVIASQEIIVPTAFTPNNDGDNDVWEIVNLDAHYPKNTVKVFNRWGNLLYESKEGNYTTNPWNGTYNGEPVPVGSYYFIIETHMEEMDDFKGIVTVIRE